MTRSHTSGFTLIELLIVVVIIGILAAIAVPKFSQTKGKAYTAAMRSDLRNLATAEESYYYDQDTYTTNLPAVKFTPSPGVVLTIVQAGPAGWAAKATHPLASVTQCSIFVGNATPIPPATVEMSVACQ